MSSGTLIFPGVGKTGASASKAATSTAPKSRRGRKSGKRRIEAKNIGTSVSVPSAGRKSSGRKRGRKSSKGASAARAAGSSLTSLYGKPLNFGLFAASTLAATYGASRWGNQFTVMEKAEDPNSGYDLRWPVGGVLVASGLFYRKNNWGQMAAAIGAGALLSWGLNKIDDWGTNAAVQGLEDDAEAGALRGAGRLNRIGKRIDRLQARKEKVADRLQAKIDRREARGRPLSPRLRAAQEALAAQAQPAAFAPLQIPAKGAYGNTPTPKMVTVPLAAVRPAYRERVIGW